MNSVTSKMLTYPLPSENECEKSLKLYEERVQNLKFIHYLFFSPSEKSNVFEIRQLKKTLVKFSLNGDLSAHQRSCLLRLTWLYHEIQGNIKNTDEVPFGNRKIKINRALFSIGCPRLMKLLESNQRLSESMPLNFKYATLLYLRNYLHRENISTPTEMGPLINLSQAASFFEMDELLKECDLKLSQQLKNQNCLQVLQPDVALKKLLQISLPLSHRAIFKTLCSIDDPSQNLVEEIAKIAEQIKRTNKEKWAVDFHTFQISADALISLFLNGWLLDRHQGTMEKNNLKENLTTLLCLIEEVYFFSPFSLEKAKVVYHVAHETPWLTDILSEIKVFIDAKTTPISLKCLAASFNSFYFSTLLSSTFKEKRENSLFLKEISKDAFVQLKTWFENGAFKNIHDISWITLIELVMVFDRFGMKTNAEIARRITLQIESLEEAATIADRFNHESLKQMCLDALEKTMPNAVKNQKRSDGGKTLVVHSFDLLNSQNPILKHCQSQIQHLVIKCVYPKPCMSTLGILKKQLAKIAYSSIVQPEPLVQDGWITKLSNLNRLCIDLTTPFPDKDLALLSLYLQNFSLYCPNLQQIKIIMNGSTLSISEAISFFNALPNSIPLHLNICEYVPYHWSQLKGKYETKNDLVSAIIPHLPQLTRLVCLDSREKKGCGGLSDKDLLMLAQHCPNLEELHFYGRPHSGLLDDAIIKIAESCSKLKTFILHNCSEVSDKSIIALTRSCQSLSSIKCLGISWLSHAILNEFAKHPTLESVAIGHCMRMNRVGFQAFLKIFKAPRKVMRHAKTRDFWP